MTTLTILLTTLTIPLEFGPSLPADSETDFALSFDRTVIGGLNSLTADTTIYTAVSQSGDGGVTWQEIVSTTMDGGLYDNPKTGLPYTASGVSSNLLPGTSRQLQATVTVVGTPVAVAGTLTSL